MDYRILGLDPAPFAPFYGLSDDELQALGAQRVPVNTPRSAPDRVELRDADPGESVLLLNHEYLDLPSPYRGRHAIFVREGATQRYDRVNELPECMRARMLSLRAFDAAGMMVDAALAQDDAVEPLIERLLARPEVAFVHAHYALRGCYAARIERA
ncbi:MAG: DUF1203 domain-containing protein [Pelomonas sp.]|nr:DUF1203 domain-containing protein [Roseateles sp.]